MARPTPTPTALKVLRGNPGKRALPVDEPRLPAGEPPRPGYFSEAQRAVWDEMVPDLVTMGVLTEADGPGLELLVVALEEWRGLMVTVNAEGHSYECETESGAKMIRAHPAVAQASDAWRRAAAQLGEFGLTPSSRTKVKSSPKKDPLDQFLSGRKKA